MSEYPDYIPPIRSEADKWVDLSSKEQYEYNTRVEFRHAKEDYDTAMSIWGPTILTYIGIPLILLFGFGFLLIILAIIWAVIRIKARSQAYKRYMDAWENMKALIADQSKQPDEI